MAKVDFNLLCASCGTSLRGVPLTGSCRICGRPVSDTVDVSSLDETTLTVNRDVTCRGCGYNLRTLPLGSVCPECATPVHLSLPADALHLADPAWLRKLRGGTTCLLLAFLGVPSVTILGGIFLIAFEPLAIGLAFVAMMCSFFFPFVGFSMLLRPEPDPPPAKSGDRAQAAGLAGLAALSLSIVLLVSGLTMDVLGVGGFEYVGVASIAALLVGLGALFVGAGMRLRDVARRSAQRRTATLGTVFLSVFIGWLAIVTLLAAVWAAGVFTVDPFTIDVLGGLCGLVYGLGVALLARGRNALTRALAMSSSLTQRRITGGGG